MKKKSGPKVAAHKEVSVEGIEEFQGEGTVVVAVGEKNKPPVKKEEKVFKYPLKVKKGTPLANVGVTLAYTHNLGNFSSAKMQISLHMPCQVQDIDETFDAVKAWTDGHLTGLIEEVVESITKK